jgi:hypothetical protein
VNFAEAMAEVIAGGRVTSDCLPQGTFVKWHPGVGAPYVTFPRTGSGFKLTDNPERQAASWWKYEGWDTYA